MDEGTFLRVAPHLYCSVQPFRHPCRCSITLKWNIDDESKMKIGFETELLKESIG
jgi:hypothetical protein